MHLKIKNDCCVSSTNRWINTRLRIRHEVVNIECSASLELSNRLVSWCQCASETVEWVKLYDNVSWCQSVLSWSKNYTQANLFLSSSSSNLTEKNPTSVVNKREMMEHASPYEFRLDCRMYRTTLFCLRQQLNDDIIWQKSDHSLKYPE